MNSTDALNHFPDDVLPPECDFPSRKDLVTAINAWARERGYAFVVKNSWKTPSGRTGVIYCCDRGTKPPSTTRIRKRNTTSRYHAVPLTRTNVKCLKTPPSSTSLRQVSSDFYLYQPFKTTLKMPQLPYTEDDVIEAMLDVTDNGLSQHEAAQKHGMPQTTLSDRLRGIPPKSEVTHPSRLLSKSQEARLITWILRQEALGYAPSHSQVRATVAALLRQQGRERPIDVHWLTRFVKRHPSIKKKIGKRQEASRFNCFTPTAVNWYFDIREREYGWIKPENTVNVDEGGIMAGFGLDSLVIGSSDPKMKAFLKGSQSRTWTSFLEAVTATGRLLKPGIIFKGKELQQQWFIEELKEIADWYYITSDNGWTTTISQLSGSEKSHVSDEWMAMCFLNNVYCCYLPAHCSHGLQPLDNGVFNASKAAYRKGLQKLAALTDSAPVDKVNFIKAYAKAREVGMTKKNILSGWRVTGNWPISRRKALMHPEIQPDKKETTPASEDSKDRQVDSDNTPKTSRHIRDLGKNESPSTRRRYSVISKGFEAQESKIASLSSRVASLEEEVGRLSRGKKRKAILNPNRKFMTLAEALVAGDTISEPNQAAEETEAVEEVIEVGGVEEDEGSNSEAEELPVARTRAGRAVKRPREY
ncbi:transposase [Fusarium oxysporum f. sp. phaseoli]